MRFVFGLLAIGVLAACSGQLPSQSEAEGTIGVGVSTLGLAIEPSIRLNETTGVRLLAATGSVDANETVDGIDYDATLDVGGVGFLGDFYPGGSAVRLSGGLLKHNLELRGRALGTVEVGGTTYTAIDLNSTVTPQSGVLPMVSVGYDQPITPNFSLTADLGAIYVGDFDVSVSDATNTVSQADIDAEAASAEDDLNGTPVVPYLRIGGAFRW